MPVTKKKPSKWENLNSSLPDFKASALFNTSEQSPVVFPKDMKEKCLTEFMLTQSISECGISENVQKINGSTSDSKVSHPWFWTIPIGLLPAPI